MKKFIKGSRLIIVPYSKKIGDGTMDNPRINDLSSLMIKNMIIPQRLLGNGLEDLINLMMA